MRTTASRSSITHPVEGAAPAPVQATPEETLARWAESLLPTVLADRHQMARFFEELSRGVVSEQGGYAAADVFYLLTHWKKFDLLVEVFKLHHDIQQRQATLRGDAEPYRFSLDFAQAADWAPDRQLLEQMCDAFRRVQVDTLKIISFHPDAMASSAVNDCIRAFLEGGTTTLAIDTALQAPEDVADALSKAPLTTLKLGTAYQPNGRPPQQHLDSHRVLLSALARSHSLQALYFDHAALTSLHEAFSHYDSRHGAPLKAIHFNVHPVPPTSPGNDIDQARCVSAIRSLASLERVKVWTGDIHLESLRDLYLKPLSGHEQLTHLELGSERRSAIAADPRFLPELARLVASCPSLTHINVTDNAAVNAPASRLITELNTRVRMGEDIDPAATVQALTQTLDGKVLPLQALTLSGHYLSAGLLKALFAMMAPDGPLRSLRRLNLSGCLLDLRTTIVEGMAALANSRSLESIALPKPSGFYVVDMDRELQVFETYGGWDRDTASLTSLPQQSGHPRNLRSVHAIAPALRNAATAFLQAPQQILDMFRAQWRANEAIVPRLTPELEAILAAARETAPRMAIPAPPPEVAALEPSAASNRTQDIVAIPLPRTAQNGPNAPAA